MHPLSYRRHRFPPVVIQHAVWLYLRFSLSYRDVEELLAERGLDISYESVRSWVLKFGPAIARALRGCRPRPSDRWHLDEMVVRIAGKHMYLWRAVVPQAVPRIEAGSRSADIGVVGTVKLRHYGKDWVQSGSVSCRDGRGAPLRCRF